MSPSPISSPRTTSGSSTPLTGGSGAIPFIHLKQSINLQEGFGGISNSSNGLYGNGPSYHDSSPDMFRGKQPGSPIFSELVPSENDVMAKQFGRPAHTEQYNGQSVLADRVSRQLLKDHVKMNRLDLSPKSPLTSRTNGVWLIFMTHHSDQAVKLWSYQTGFWIYRINYPSLWTAKEVYLQNKDPKQNKCEIRLKLWKEKASGSR